MSFLAAFSSFAFRSESFTFKYDGFGFRFDCFYRFTFHLTASTVCFVKLLLLFCCGSMMLEGGFQVFFCFVEVGLSG
ncbi:hypothetical protein HanRHA438_Chr07g0305211 [Helianthus annuus]|uniref:Uncharacterized protein n=1 Tax=Helianthus annuus TaxID=4232 RepID=A0A9K3NGD7_HELAN|nr:hypothetical protein HanXRQr2_Chr07g0295051 [Helianthus annuus]KAJ0550195.1 hypothetical protein HanHA300_Chr07g0242621 [Helianthus annuus]KAJ0563150.1 hypothetical protein HanHA89_Chr07g0259821 [Helianthus annuus]KAJ0728518.1 hypothetical protein HanLR1_Chr07g0242511 [Helianthus annuus]KAJ0731269.1 hypothetical protein HanOQP8_Chr07g0250011 [Helianthus annuus]